MQNSMYLPRHFSQCVTYVSLFIFLRLLDSVNLFPISLVCILPTTPKSLLESWLKFRQRLPRREDLYAAAHGSIAVAPALPSYYRPGPTGTKSSCPLPARHIFPTLLLTFPPLRSNKKKNFSKSSMAPPPTPFLPVCKSTSSKIPSGKQYNRSNSEKGNVLCMA